MFDVQEAIDNFDSLNGSVVRADRVTRAKPSFELCNTPSASTIETYQQHNSEHLTRDIGHEGPRQLD